MIKLGMIGGGINSAVGRAHVAALRMTGLFDLVGGCFSRDMETNLATAKKYGCMSFESPSFARNWVDRVVVLSPTPLHYEHVLQCVDTGIPVLCEKALAERSEHAEHIELRSKSSPVACVFNYAFYPAVQWLRKLIRDGELGDVTHVHVEMPQSGYLTGRPQDWRMTDTGVYLDLGVHLHHLVWFLTGEQPARVRAEEAKYSELRVVDYVSAQVSYSSFACHMWFSKCSAGRSNGLRVRVFGTKGSAEWYQRTPDVLDISSEAAGAVGVLEAPNPRFKLGHPTGFGEALANLYEAWAENPRHYDLSPQVAHGGLLLMEAMRESARTERMVML